MPPRAVAMSGPGLLLGPIAGFMSLTQPRSVLMSEAPDTAKDEEDRAVQSWLCPSLAVAPERTGPTPYQLKRSGDTALHLTLEAC